MPNGRRAGFARDAMTGRTLRRRAVLAVPLLLLGIGGPAQAADTPITLALSSTTLAYGGLRIAERAKMFQLHGLEPRIIVMDSGNAAISAVLGHSADFSSAGPGEVLAAAVRGRQVVIVLNVYRGLSGSLILAKPVADKLGIAANAPVEQRLRALDGLSIAAPSATSAYLTPYKGAAEAAGAKIKFVYMTQPAMVAALQVGAVQGIIVGAPFSLTPVTQGSGVLWISGPKGELPPAFRPASSAGLQTSEEYAAAHPQIIAQLRAVFDDLAKLIRDKPDEAEALLAQAYPSVDAAAAFSESAANWSQPVMTADDIAQEIRIQVASGSLPGVADIKPASVLYHAK